MVYFEFVYDVRVCSSLVNLHVAVQLSFPQALHTKTLRTDK